MRYLHAYVMDELLEKSERREEDSGQVVQRGRQDSVECKVSMVSCKASMVSNMHRGSPTQDLPFRGSVCRLITMDTIDFMRYSLHVDPTICLSTAEQIFKFADMMLD